MLINIEFKYGVELMVDLGKWINIPGKTKALMIHSRSSSGSSRIFIGVVIRGSVGSGSGCYCFSGVPRGRTRKGDSFTGESKIKKVFAQRRKQILLQLWASRVIMYSTISYNIQLISLIVVVHKKIACRKHLF